MAKRQRKGHRKVAGIGEIGAFLAGIAALTDAIIKLVSALKR
jgi:hypothetical protein